MPENENPFVGMSTAGRAAVEQLLSDIWASGEWSDDHEKMLDQWRAAIGDDGKTGWSWWAGEVGAEMMTINAPTRDEAIAAARLEPDFREAGKFEVVEAREWADSVKEGDEYCEFADARNKAVIPLADNDLEAAHAV